MSLSQDQKEFVRDTIDACRLEVDGELREIRREIMMHQITPEQAEAIALRAAQHAKVMTKQEIVNDAKMEIANGAIEILKRSFQVMALFIVGLAFYIGGKKWPWH